MSLRVGFVGTGESPGEKSREGFAMAYKHAAGYRRLDACELVACADIVPENAAAFADEFGIEHSYEDTGRMLGERDLDVVSVCVPPGAHAEVVLRCARQGDLRAVHCEKPIATTWGDCRRMVEVCDSEGVQLTINHQKRTGIIYNRAKELVAEGAVGDLQRIEIAAVNLFDAGSHWFDLCDFFLDGSRAEWVIAQVDYRDENRWFGAHNENQAIAQWRYENGVYGLASMGEASDAVSGYVRLVGDDGVIEIGAEDAPPMRIRNGSTRGWRAVHTGENIWGDRNLSTPKAALAALAPSIPFFPDDPFERPGHIDRAIESVVTAVLEGEESELNARTALRATELIFASWESARRRGRVDLPLDIDDNPLVAMVEAGQLPVSS